jgi:D-arabinose 1-dehydrogenase-like Zn-dependent alcohol dehydrogenase
MDLIFGSRKLEGALTGDPATGDATLRFSALSGVSAMIETVPLERAADAYAKMMAGKGAVSHRSNHGLTICRCSGDEISI